jgi:hypothetical protein
MMETENSKKEKKLTKAKVKIAKAEIKAKIVELERTQPEVSDHKRSLPEGVGININKHEGSSELVISGLSDAQLERLLPQVNREVLITVTEDRNSVMAGLMRFVREGIFHTIIKVVAGLIVGYLLLKFGLN